MSDVTRYDGEVGINDEDGYYVQYADYVYLEKELTLKNANLQTALEDVTGDLEDAQLRITELEDEER